MDNELGARIRTLRKERGLSQEALAQALEVSRQAVTKWEDGSSLPSTANLFALSGFFGVPLAELTGTPDGNAPASISEKTRDKRTKTLRIGAWVLLAVSVPVLLICAVQYFTAGPPIPEDVSIVGGVDGDRHLRYGSVPFTSVFSRTAALCRGTWCADRIENQKVERKNT